MRGDQPNSLRALLASPSRVSTSAGTEITRVDGYDSFAMLVIGLLFYPGSLPCEVDVKTCRSHGDKFADTVLHPGGDDIVRRALLLKHQPLHLHVIASVPQSRLESRLPR